MNCKNIKALELGLNIALKIIFKITFDRTYGTGEYNTTELSFKCFK